MTDRVDVLVIGAGPAGVAAAVTAAENGARVAIVDESPRVGGQVWHGPIPPRARAWLDRLRVAGVQVHASTPIVDLEPGQVHTDSGALACDRLVLACGARELLLPFPGWTLPAVTGGGGLQALVHDGFDVSGMRIVVGGTGPLLLQVAHQLREHGAHVLRIAEQASVARLLRFGLALPFAKKREAMELLSTSLRASSWIESVSGDDRALHAVVRTPLGTESIECDRVAAGFSLVPNLELPMRLGCVTTGDGVRVDVDQQSSVGGVFAAGEVCGIKGAGGAIQEGICAGHAVTGTPTPAAVLAARDAEREFGRRLARAFALRDELGHLADDRTILCRCEDVRAKDLAPHKDWTSAKLHTRCGMGLCQGRVCGAATRTLFGWGPTSSRPPLVPVPVGALMNERTEA